VLFSPKPKADPLIQPKIQWSWAEGFGQQQNALDVAPERLWSEQTLLGHACRLGHWEHHLWDFMASPCPGEVEDVRRNLINKIKHIYIYNTICLYNTMVQNPLTSTNHEYDHCKHDVPEGSVTTVSLRRCSWMWHKTCRNWKAWWQTSITSQLKAPSWEGHCRQVMQLGEGLLHDLSVGRQIVSRLYQNMHIVNWQIVMCFGRQIGSRLHQIL
jgi:hypothetical protein